MNKMKKIWQKNLIWVLNLSNFGNEKVQLERGIVSDSEFFKWAKYVIEFEWKGNEINYIQIIKQL